MLKPYTQTHLHDLFLSCLILKIWSLDIFSGNKHTHYNFLSKHLSPLRKTQGDGKAPLKVLASCLE